ncbi:MAG: peptidoglycan DD-metalloendopeptidase family protein [Chloroflexi bacterium]|nr:peptidoglycan DD-metalloendopeptidase family protein [Chloroflexota bacterium]
MNKIRISIFFLFGLFLLMPIDKGQAQSEPDYPFYIIQSGDTLLVVAERFGISIDDLINLNEIENPDSLAIGTVLKIPGFEGVTGELVLYTANLGDSYQTLTKQNQYPVDLIARLNHLANPEEIYVGSRIVIPVSEDHEPLQLFAVQPPSQSILETAVTTGKNLWEIILANPDIQPGEYLAGDMLYQAGEEDEEIPSISIPGVEKLDVSPLPFVQGKTIEIKVTTISSMELRAVIDGKPVSFFEIGENEYVALHGISAQAETGIISIELSGSQGDQEIFSINQRILVESGYYGEGPAVTVDPITIQPEVTEPEQEMVEGITSKVNEERYWDGIFQSPVDEPCVSAAFGSSRIYNGTYHYYHTGIDFAVCSASNANVYSAAPGYVVFAGPLVVRGNAVIIDHGWGIYTGYWHQSSLIVKTGDYVEAGQQLGYIGTTGRSTGYHLHFEVWVNGTQVDPTDWLINEYP